ncbi:RNA polymerase sigma factor [Myxococcota bacterium]|nr:RNA polymerase sigma factor [Myxococcota bacterium]
MTAKVIPLRAVEARGTELSDEALLAACALEDQTALAMLYQRHHQAVYRFLGRLVGHRSSELDDIAQQVFLAVWRQADDYRGQSNVRAWIFGIAANLARRHHRTVRRRSTAFEKLSHWISRAEPAHDDRVANRQLVDRLAAALDELPHDLRVAYVMCEIEEVPGVEAAKVVGCAPGTMWRRLHDARKQLREKLEAAR